MAKMKNISAALLALSVLWLFSGSIWAQGSGTFQVFLTDLAGNTQLLQSVLELEIDDIVVDYQPLSEVPPNEPELAAAAKAGFRLYAPGSPHWGSAHLTLAPGSEADELVKWLDTTENGQGERKSISVILMNDAGEEVGSYILKDSAPLVWSPRSNRGVADGGGTLEVSIGGIELREKLKGTVQSSGDFAFGIADANGMPDYDFNWDSWSGGEPAVLLTGLLSGASYWTQLPGRMTVEPLVLKGHMTGNRKTLCQWVNDTLQGAKTSSLFVDGPRGTRGPTLTSRATGRNREFRFDNCILTRYVFPRMSVTNTTGNVLEEVHIKPIRVEMK